MDIQRNQVHLSVQRYSNNLIISSMTHPLSPSPQILLHYKTRSLNHFPPFFLKAAALSRKKGKSVSSTVTPPHPLHHPTSKN